MKWALPLVLATTACEGPEPLQNAQEIARQRTTLPSISVVDALELRLRRSNCVGEPFEWDRQYNFRLGTSHLVQFILIDAKALGSPGQRHVGPPGASISAPDVPAKMTAGTYNLNTGDLSIAVCREIMQPPPSSNGS